ncbi:Crp/Fnr family transcriptional regulator [Rubrivivax sp. RP6-9]|uniref:Crp/Fnr family transcriptional regulator n=1 Tax=Rubrivivax sp. RP6-9 TaxID=3415750 RepID=UPI003CC5902A
MPTPSLAPSEPSPPCPAAPGHLPGGQPSVLPNAGSLAELLRLLGLSRSECDLPALPPCVRVLRIRPDATLLHEGTPGRAVYVVRSGTFKCVRMLEDGDEQVLSFAQAGELLGFEALHGGARRCSAVALEDATAYALALGELHELQRRCPAFGDALRHGLSRQLTLAAETAEMVSTSSADARLARFVLWSSARMAQAGHSPTRFRLRMGRRDIASLLRLANETVSRSFSLLADSGCLRVAGREIEVLDLAALRERARNTRIPPSDTARQRSMPTGDGLPGIGHWWTGSAARLAA